MDMSRVSINNPHLLGLLMQDDVRGFNQWRRKNPDIELHFLGLNLGRRQLPEINLNNVSFFGVDLSFTRLVRASLNGAHLHGVMLGSTDLTHAELRDALLLGVNFLRARLDHAVFSHAHSYRANFNWANAYRTDFCGMELVLGTFMRTNLDSANFTDADLLGTDLTHARITNGLFYGAKNLSLGNQTHITRHTRAA